MDQMDVFLKEHWFRLGLLFILVVSVGASAYYFFAFKPQENLRELSLQLQFQKTKEVVPVVAARPISVTQSKAASTQTVPAQTISNNSSMSSDSLSQAVLKEIMSRIVYVKCYGAGNNVQGSGSAGLISSADPIVVTNFHVVGAAGGISATCTINTPQPPDYSPGDFFSASVGLFDPNYPSIDAAVLHIQNVSQADLPLFGKFPLPFCDESKVQVGDKVTILGYPGIGLNTLTVTDGIISGFIKTDFGVVYKTSSILDHGVSGGLAVLNKSACVLGIPTWEITDYQSGANLGYIESWDSIRKSNQIFGN